jgi:hypothetical protein
MLCTVNEIGELVIAVGERYAGRVVQVNVVANRDGLSLSGQLVSRDQERRQEQKQAMLRKLQTKRWRGKQ